MNYLFTGLVFIVIFSVLVLVHELGHFLMAKRAGIKVEEFGLGLPPRLFGKKKGGTIYSINWIPFGGFVRMLGEDASDTKILKNKRSFAAQTMRNRILVVVAGVVMNFILAWLLMVIGFVAGMEPLLGPGDVLGAVNDGKVVIQEGLVVLEDADSAGDFPVGQRIFQVDGENLSGSNVWEFYDQAKEKGIKFQNFAPFPRTEILSLSSASRLFAAGLREGDMILRVNGKEIFTTDDYEIAVKAGGDLRYEVFRNQSVVVLDVIQAEIKKTVISQVFPDSPAEKSGFMAGDLIVKINDQGFAESSEIVEFVGQNQELELNYLIERGENQLILKVKPEEGRIGVMISNLVDYGNFEDLSLFNTELIYTIVEVKAEKYSLPVAAYKAVGEVWRLSKLTAIMFVDFVGNLISSGEVPDTVAGPVGIAQLTHVFVQEGLIPILRFTAILSLSLGVINILPFPALDGGRLLFLLIELIIGRRVNQRWEAFVHGLGYLLILFLIVVVTYSDIVKIFL